MAAPPALAANWYNYTRTYPSGNYLLYARMSSGNLTLPAAELLNLQTSGHGTAGLDDHQYRTVCRND